MNPMQMAFALRKQICGMMDYFLLPVDEDLIDMEKQ